MDDNTTRLSNYLVVALIASGVILVLTMAATEIGQYMVNKNYANRAIEKGCVTLDAR